MLFRGNSSKDFVYINTFNTYNSLTSWYFYYLLFNIQCAKLCQVASVMSVSLQPCGL